MSLGRKKFITLTDPRERFTKYHLGPQGKAQGLSHVAEDRRRGASLVAQWLRISMPKQGTRV